MMLIIFVDKAYKFLKTKFAKGVFTLSQQLKKRPSEIANINNPVYAFMFDSIIMSSFSINDKGDIITNTKGLDVDEFVDIINDDDVDELAISEMLGVKVVRRDSS